MNRRTFVSGVAAAAAVGAAGCLGGEGTSQPRTDDEHLERLRTEIGDRGVDVESVELDDAVVAVEHGADGTPNDAIANVAMAFVERIADEWDVDRLEGLLHRESGDLAWHAEAEWARAYADGEISPEEYGSRLSGTTSPVLDTDTDTDGADDSGGA
jgi:hypothetical protein